MNDNATTKACSQCGDMIPPDAPQGLCPKCVLGGVVTTTEVSQPADEPELPRLEAVRAAFPQLEVLELIGQGGMGFVYKARQLNLDRFVALKLLWPKLGADPAFAERFSREARVLARLNHPNIVAVYDFGQSGGFFYLLIEFVDGVNLRQAMQAARFSPQQALSLVPKICEALQFAHDEGILHRDIKPENILLDAKGRVKIADFGIAKLVGEPRPVTKLTATGAAVGTPNYMAPEQLEHPEDVDQRADIYSVGVVFYEMLTGELPMGRFAPPSKKTTIDERVDEIVLKALARERELRQQSAGEVKTQVESLQTPAPSGQCARPAPAPGSANSGPQTVGMAVGSAGEGWSHLAIWGAVLTGLSLPLPLLILLSGFLGIGGIGAGEFWITLGCTVCLGIPGTLLGWMALSQIRRSLGQLQGLPLALFAALTWPLLVPFLGTLLPPALIVTPEPVTWGPALLLLPIGVLIFEVWAVRAAARWGSGGVTNPGASRTGQIPIPPSGTAAPAGTSKATPWSKTAIVAAVLAALGLFPPLLMIVITNWPHPSPSPKAPSQEVSVEVTSPSKETFIVTAIILSNGVPVSGRDLRAKLSPSSGRKPSRFTVRWQELEASGGEMANAPWEVLVDDKSTGTIAARLRPANLPPLTWTVSTQAANIGTKLVTREAWAFEVARALQTSGGGNVGAADWSVRLQFQSSPPQPTTSKRGIDADFVLPAHQVGIFEVVTRSNGVVVPVPELGAYVINGGDTPYAGKFLWADDPEDLDGQTGVPRWKFGILGPDGSNLAQGLGVPTAPAHYSGATDLWIALKPDDEVVEGLLDSNPSRPPFGLRIRTQVYQTAPGQISRSMGQGTNWMGSAALPGTPTAR